MLTLHLVIKGKVQGVFYRASAKKIAAALAINGWIRNMDDGNVEVLVTGNDMQLREFVNWCYEGPGGAVVSEVIETAMEEIKFDSFSIQK